MRINSITNNNNNFKGFDARELKGLILTDKTYTIPLKNALGNLSIDIFTPEFTAEKLNNEYTDLINKKHILWGQDYITVLNAKSPAILFDQTRDFLKPVLSEFSKQLKDNQNFHVVNENFGFHLRGGNFFVCKKDGKNILLIGENKSYIPENVLKFMYNAQEICKIPQADYHLDLFIRPLENGVVLVSDIGLTQKGLKEGIIKLQNYLKTNKISSEKSKQINKIIKMLKNELQFLDITLEGDSYFPLKTIPKIVDTLRNAGLKPIRVPATYHRLKAIKTEDTIAEARKKFEEYADSIRQKIITMSPQEGKLMLDLLNSQRLENEQNPKFGMKLVNSYFNNFINAIVHKENGELHYITNDSLLDEYLGITPEIAEETGFSTKKLFEKSVEKFVKKSNIHYLDKETTKTLFDFMGGVHCLVAEVM